MEQDVAGHDVGVGLGAALGVHRAGYVRELAERCIKAIQDFAYSGFGGRGGKHGDIFWDNESYAIKQYLKMFAELASATLKQVADWFVWLASTLGRFFDERSGKAERNANELRLADHEVHDIADGRYDGRIQKFQQGISR